MSSAVFLTGVTGFLGKVLLEALLRRADDLGIGTIFALVRAPSQEAAESRLAREVFASECFADAGASRQIPVVAVRGDLHQPGLGIVPEVGKRLATRVGHVIHCAASIEFDLPLGQAAEINVAGALEVLSLARKFEARPIFSQVSTAYVHPHRGNRVLEEQLVQLPRSAEEIYAEICRGDFSEKALLRETGHPNTYTLTKCLAEHLIANAAGGVEVRVLRPSIISACIERPFPGWIDSGAAFAGFVAMLGTGQLQAVSARPEVALDVVPCDAVAHRLIEMTFAPAPTERTQAEADRTPEIEQCVAGPDASCTIASCREVITRFFGANPVSRGPRIRYVGEYGVTFRLADALFHALPLTLAARISRMRGNSRKASAAARSLERIRGLNRTFAYFTHRDFCFASSRSLSPLRPDAYLELVCRGVYRHLLRGNEREAPLAGSEFPGAQVAHDDTRGRIRTGLARWLAARASPWVTFDRTSFEKNLSGLPPNARIVFATARAGSLDARLVELLLRSNPQLTLGAPFIVRKLDQARQKLQLREVPIFDGSPDRRDLERLARHARSGDSVVPVTVYYEGAEERELRGLGLWARLLSGRRIAGRVHIRCAEPLSLVMRNPESWSSALELPFRQAETDDTYSLRQFLAGCQLEVDTAWLADAIQRRGGQVIRGKLRERTVDASPSSLPKWFWRFLPELAQRYPDREDLSRRAERVIAFLPETTVSRDPGDPGDSNADRRLAELLDEILRRMDPRPD